MSYTHSVDVVEIGDVVQFFKFDWDELEAPMSRWSCGDALYTLVDPPDFFAALEAFDIVADAKVQLERFQDIFGEYTYINLENVK